MEIVDVKTTPIVLPSRRHWMWNGLRSEVGRIVIVELVASNGLIGIGEACPFIEGTGESQESVVSAVQTHFRPVVTGRSPFDIQSLEQAMAERVMGHMSTKAAISMALFDLQGQVTGLPLYALIGGRCRDGVRIAHTIGIMSKADAVSEAVSAQEDGSTAIQVKATGEIDRDLDILKAVCRAVDRETLIWIDANGAYANRPIKETIAVVRELVNAGAEFVEQPCLRLEHMALIQQSTEAMIIADESLYSETGTSDSWATDVREHASIDALSIYVSKSGGITGARSLAAAADWHGLPCNINGAYVSGITNAASVHLGVSLRAASLPCPIPITSVDPVPQTAGRYFTDDVVTTGLRFEGGLLCPAERPGLGVKLDRERITKYEVQL